MSTSTVDHIKLAEKQISIFSFQLLVVVAAYIREATDALLTRAQTCTASYMVLRRYLPKPQSHQEALILLCSWFCQREADRFQHPFSSIKPKSNRNLSEQGDPKAFPIFFRWRASKCPGVPQEAKSSDAAPAKQRKG